MYLFTNCTVKRISVVGEGQMINYDKYSGRLKVIYGQVAGNDTPCINKPFVNFIFSFTKRECF